MSVRFHREAEGEYTEAIHYYLALHVKLAEAFVDETSMASAQSSVIL